MMESTPPAGTTFPLSLPWAFFPEGPLARALTLGSLSLAPGRPQEDCGLQPAGRCASQRPLCLPSCQLHPWPLGIAWPFLPAARQSHFFLCPQIPIW